MPRHIAWVAAAALLMTQAFLSAVAFERVSRGTRSQFRPFAVEPFRPVVSEVSSAAAQSLAVGDRILRAGGRDVRSMQDVDEALQRGADSGVIELTVLGPGGKRDVQLGKESGAAPEDSGAAGWFTFLLWPAICSLLAVAVLFWNGESKRAWTGALALAGMAQTQSLIVRAVDFQGALRWWMAIAIAALPVIGLICLYRIAMNWPRRWWDSRLGGRARAAIYALIGAYGALRFSAEVAALADYRATEGLSPATGVYSLLAVGLLTGAAVALMLRTFQWNSAHYAGEEGWDARVLKIGQWVFSGSLGVLAALVPLLSQGDTLAALGHPAAWIPLALSLAWPAAIGMAAARREEKVALAAPPPVNADTWNELHSGIAEALPASTGLRLLALYGRVGEIYCVRSSVPGIRSWEPLGPDDMPQATRDLIWLEMPLEDLPRAGWMVFLSEDFTGRPGEAVVHTLEKLARAAAPVAARL